MAVNDIYEVSIRGRMEGQRTINVRHYKVFSESPGTPLTPQQIATAAGVQFASPLKTALSSAWALEAIRVQKIFPLPVAVSLDDISVAGPGLVAGDNLPTTVAVVLTLQTSLAGRANRGRVYLPGIPEAYSTGSVLNATGLTALANIGQNFENALVSAGGNGSLSAVILHRVDNSTIDITQSRLNPTFGTQRKRRLSYGE